MTEEVQARTCGREIHNGVERERCGKRLVKGKCPNDSQHVMKITTGFCNVGFHEGTKPVAPSGNGNKVCTFFMTCSCKCHVELDEFFKMAGRERVGVQNPKYVIDIKPFNIEDYLPVREETVHSRPVNPMTATALEGTTPTPPEAPHAPLTARRTDTGRAGRGTLEAQVWEQCCVFAAAGIPATPRMLSELIAKKYSIPLPSTGAIGAVFDRWVKYEFAEVERKPLRFVGWTGDGEWETLEKAKAAQKQGARKAASMTRRGFR